MKNIIMIMSDSLRYDHIGALGNDWIKTPNLDSLVSQSAVFENAYPEGLPTLPVRTALFTGNYTLTNRFWQGLVPQDVTLAEILDEHGYVNGLITDTYHLAKPNMNYHRGFHTFDWIRGQESDAWNVGPNKFDLTKYSKPAIYDTVAYRLLDQYLRNLSLVDWKNPEERYAAQVRRSAVNWLEQAKTTGRPFFLHVDFFDPHEPWLPPEPYNTMYTDPDYDGLEIINPKGGPSDWMTPEELKYTKAMYAGVVSHVDAEIGRLLQSIEQMGLLDDSYIIFLADHGHPFSEHGIMLKDARNLYNELLKIPLMVRFPNKEYAGKRISALAQTVDIAPTILSLLSLERENRYMQGESLLPLINGEKDKIYDFVVSGFFNIQDRCLRNEKYSFIYRDIGPNELYDQANDPAEQHNLCYELPEIAEEMENSIPKTFWVRLQKEHGLQNHWPIEGTQKTYFPPERYWKK